jgi:alternate signal-mediated exported protein
MSIGFYFSKIGVVTMKLRRFHSSKGIMLLVTVVAGLLIVLGSTFAWVTSQSGKANQFHTNSKYFKVDVVDVFNPKNPWNGSDPTSASSNKTVGAQNYGNMPAFVRIMAQPVMLTADGTPLPAQMIDPDNDISTPGGLNTSGDPSGSLTKTAQLLMSGTGWYDPSKPSTPGWVLGTDGYYYYIGRLEAGTQTVPDLFTGISLSTAAAADPDYVNASLDIQVQMEAVDPTAFSTAWWNIPTGAPTTPGLPGTYPAYEYTLQQIYGFLQPLMNGG